MHPIPRFESMDKLIHFADLLHVVMSSTTYIQLPSPMARQARMRTFSCPVISDSVQSASFSWDSTVSQRAQRRTDVNHHCLSQRPHDCHHGMPPRIRRHLHELRPDGLLHVCPKRKRFGVPPAGSGNTTTRQRLRQLLGLAPTARQHRVLVPALVFASTHLLQHQRPRLCQQRAVRSVHERQPPVERRGLRQREPCLPHARQRLHLGRQQLRLRQLQRRRPQGAAELDGRAGLVAAICHVSNHVSYGMQASYVVHPPGSCPLSALAS